MVGPRRCFEAGAIDGLMWVIDGRDKLRRPNVRGAWSYPFHFLITNLLGSPFGATALSIEAKRAIFWIVRKRPAIDAIIAAWGSRPGGGCIFEVGRLRTLSGPFRVKRPVYRCGARRNFANGFKVRQKPRAFCKCLILVHNVRTLLGAKLTFGNSQNALNNLKVKELRLDSRPRACVRVRERRWSRSRHWPRSVSSRLARR